MHATVIDVLKACRTASDDSPVMETMLRATGAGAMSCAYAMDEALRQHLVRYDSAKRHLVMTESGRLMLNQAMTAGS